MKIKIDFVTNSSSTAYVVFIPNSFKVTREKAEEMFDAEYYAGRDEAFTDDILHDIEQSIELLKMGDYLWSYGDEGTPPAVYYAVLSICNDNGLVVSSSEMGGEGNNSIFGIKEEQVVDILKNHMNLSELVNTANKGVQLCYEGKKDSR